MSILQMRILKLKEPEELCQPLGRKARMNFPVADLQSPIPSYFAALSYYCINIQRSFL